ncbi:hypothetical protein PIROE2DRAFT_20347 [Piromyces sp. E2]|nr:hypothetical protein PIROE2DRAFT_20347 [Piromyces sp. E2]|eukprot:OUM65363.1 hypothetical protein PIROE2DRAFT_20347 [Piromyces sp. E2]
MDINKLHQALDELMISQEEKNHRSYQQQPMKRPMNNFNPENYYPNPNNISNKNVTYYAKTVNPNTLSSDEYYNDEYYNDGYSNNNSYSNSNINTPSANNDYYYNKGSSYNSSNSSLGSRDKNMRNFEQLKIKTHSRTQSSSSDQVHFNRERRPSQDTMGSSLFSPVSSAVSQSSMNEPMTASIKSDISAVTLQTLSFDLASGFLNRITSSAGFIKNSKRYYFVLDTNGLYYFKTNDPFARAKGFIKFDSKTKIKDIKENSSAKDKNSKIIELEVYKDNKSHQVVLQAEDPEDRDMWHRALKKTIVRQKYVNEALPPLPQAPSSASQPVPITPSGGRSRSQSQSSSRHMSQHSPSQSYSSNQSYTSNQSYSSNQSYTQQLRLSQQKMANNFEGNSSAPLSKKSSLQNISDINLAVPNMYALQNRRRPSLDVQMFHHERTSSLSSLNETNRQRYSYGSNFSNQSHGSNHYN